MEDKLVSEFLSLVQVDDFEGTYSKDIAAGRYFGMPLEAIISAERRLLSPEQNGIAYFSMEYGLATSFYNKFVTSRPIDPSNKLPENEVFSNFRLADYFFDLHIDNIIDLPIYSGGLGVLAGDTMKTMADYKLPAAGLGMLWHSGYFRQKFWFKYGQAPEKMEWDPRTYPGLIPLKNKVKISLKFGDIWLKLWKYYVYSYKHDYAVPLILLDTDTEPNDAKVRELTDQLYRADDKWFKILQRVILGFGGINALKELGYNIDKFHLNEGHAVFAFIEKARGLSAQAKDALKDRFVYTCHTPVAAGHDRFSIYDLGKVLKDEDMAVIEESGRENDGIINLTLLAMNISSSTNAVSKNHQKVMHLQFPGYKERIKYVTNGVHPYTWISRSFMELFEKYAYLFKDVKSNPMILSKVGELRENVDFRKELWKAHQVNKANLCGFLKDWKLDKDIFTVCWARRIAAYKRPSLILHDVKRLLGIAKKTGPVQVILAGKAHPNDNLGGTYVNEILDTIDSLSEFYDALKIIALENYDISMAKVLTCGVDVWLNNPLPPFEASGTSGMKAILNGVLQVSTLDGWVAEAADRNIGRIFGYRNKEGEVGSESELHLDDDADKLYGVLEEIVGLYYQTNQQGKLDPASSWIDMMIDCVNTGSYFNTYRMFDEYKHNIWAINKTKLRV
ncbi:MAG: alpha-glucan family phosphorylase [Candidatus Omnitrophota bacterium]|jgi:starch phosphorylase